jgi:Nucleoside-diphosphate-sugar epimerases
MPACVVTGGTGNIGQALVRLLLSEGWRTYVLCNPLSLRTKFLPDSPQCRIVACDLGNIAQAKSSIDEPCEQFFHLGWRASYGVERENPQAQISNIEASVEAAELAARLGCDVFVGAGSQAQYGDTNDTLTEDTPLRPTTHYGIAKCCAEQMTRKVCAQRGVRHVWGRVCSVYGPCDGPYTLVTYLMCSFLRGQEAVLTPCLQEWDFMYAEDAARAFVALAEKGHDSQAYCLATGQARPLWQYMLEWKRVTEGKALLRLGGRPYPKGARQRLCADISRLVEHTEFSSATPFAEGMRKTLAWYREHLDALNA